MLVVLLCMYLCMYLRQVVSLPALLGIERDLFLCIELEKEDELEPAVVPCSVAVPLFPAVYLQSRQVRWGTTGIFPEQDDSRSPWFAVGLWPRM